MLPRRAAAFTLHPARGPQKAEPITAVIKSLKRWGAA
jgi:hypothetical protein